MVGLDEYRIQVIEQLKNCQSPKRAQDLLEEVDLMLKSSQLSESTQRKFWQTLGSDVEVITQDSLFLLEKNAAAALARVLVVAQETIAEYRQSTGGGDSRPEVPD